VLGGALKSLFETGALDDHVAVAETGLNLRRAVLVPEAGDLLLHLCMVRSDDDVMALGEDVQELGTPLRCTLDLDSDVVECSHHL
jgi:hypothetical protein